jgi:hypothetical protein
VEEGIDMMPFEVNKCIACQDYFRISIERKLNFENNESFLKDVCDNCLLVFMRNLEEWIRLEEKQFEVKDRGEGFKDIALYYNKLRGKP